MLLYLSIRTLLAGEHASHSFYDKTAEVWLKTIIILKIVLPFFDKILNFLLKIFALKNDTVSLGFLA
jgi:hypothetical protein